MLGSEQPLTGKPQLVGVFNFVFNFRKLNTHSRDGCKMHTLKNQMVSVCTNTVFSAGNLGKNKNSKKSRGHQLGGEEEKALM